MVISMALGVAAYPVSIVHQGVGNVLAGLAAIIGALFVWAAFQETTLRAFLERTVVDHDAESRAARRYVCDVLVAEAVEARPGSTVAHRRPRAATTLKEAS